MRLISCGPEIAGDLTAYDFLLIADLMFRKTLTILSFLGLLLSVGLWVASHWHMWYVQDSFLVYANYGVLDLARVHHVEFAKDVRNEDIAIVALSRIDSDQKQRIYDVTRDKRFKFNGFFGSRLKWMPGTSIAVRPGVVVPLWMPMAALFGLIWWVNHSAIAKCVRRVRDSRYLQWCSRAGILLCLIVWVASYFPVTVTGSAYQLRIERGLCRLSYDRARPLGATYQQTVRAAGVPHIVLGKNWVVENPAFKWFRDYTWWFPNGSPIEATRWGIGICIPLSVPTLLFVALFALSRPLWHSRRRRRERLGLCLRCGYDLRASEARCPECGAAFERERKEAGGVAAQKGTRLTRQLPK